MTASAELVEPLPPGAWRHALAGDKAIDPLCFSSCWGNPDFSDTEKRYIIERMQALEKEAIAKGNS